MKYHFYEFNYNKHFLFSLFYTLLVSISYSQEKSIEKDSLLNRFIKEKKFKIGYPIINDYIKQNKKTKNYYNLGRAYYYMAFKKIDNDSCIKYLDSSFVYFNKLKNSPFKARLFWLKGQHYHLNRNFKKALETYIQAEKYSKLTGNNEYYFRSTQNIGLLNNRIGYYKEALKIFRNNYFFANKNNYEDKKYVGYLKTVFSLADVFNNLKMVDSARHYNKIGLEISEKKKHKFIYNLFLLNHGNTLRIKGDYDNAMIYTNKALKVFREINNKPNIAVGSYFLGEIYNYKGNKNLAMENFSVVDSIFNQTNDVLPRCRKSYKYLIEYYNSKNDYKKQLYYTNQLLKLDSVLADNYKYISKTIYNDYEKPQLLSDRKNLIAKLNSKTKKSNILLWLLLAVVLLSSIIIIQIHRRKKKLARLFSELMDEKETKKKTVKIENEKNGKSLKNINEDIVQKIISSLNDFEKEQGFLEKNITLASLAKSMHTNSTYLSKVINSIKGTTFSNYINSLRIEYVIYKLKNDTKFRKYTIKAIAFEVGFKSSEAFSKTFKKHTGLYPSYFIKKIKD